MNAQDAAPQSAKHLGIVNTIFILTAVYRPGEGHVTFSQWFATSRCACVCASTRLFFQQNAINYQLLWIKMEHFYYPAEQTWHYRNRLQYLSLSIYFLYFYLFLVQKLLLFRNIYFGKCLSKKIVQFSKNWFNFHKIFKTYKNWSETVTFLLLNF